MQRIQDQFVLEISLWQYSEEWAGQENEKRCLGVDFHSPDKRWHPVFVLFFLLYSSVCHFFKDKRRETETLRGRVQGLDCPLPTDEGQSSGTEMVAAVQINVTELGELALSKFPALSQPLTIEKSELELRSTGLSSMSESDTIQPSPGICLNIQPLP